MKVLISGAGIAGLSLALRLHQRGLTPIVVERSPRPRGGGYMLGLSDPGYDAAERMGVVDALKATEYMPKRLVYLGRDGREKFALQGRALEVMVGERQLNLLRGDIEQVLYDHVRDAVEIRFGTVIDAVEMTAGRVFAHLDDGAAIESDLIVGADGLHSKVRALCFGPEDRFVHFLGSRVAAFLLPRSDFPSVAPDTTYSLTEVGRAAGLAAIGHERMVAFFIYRTEEDRSGTVDVELSRAFAGVGWLVPELLSRMAQANGVYFDDVSLVIVSPSWAKGRAVLLGDAGHAVSLIAGKGATLAMAGAVVLAEALAEHADVAGALAHYEVRLRPLAEAAQTMARRNVNLFTPANGFQLRTREIAMRLATWPLVARLAKRLLNPPGERL